MRMSCSVAQACNRKNDRLWVRIPIEKKKYLIFSILRSDGEAKLAVEIRHSTRNTITIRRKVGRGSALRGNGVS